jgi:hypothetical protein
MNTHCAEIRRPSRLTRRLVLVVAVALAAIGATSGAAFAYWTSHGTGTGTGTTGTMTISVTALLVGDNNATTLVPNGAGDVILRVSNPNAFTVHVSSITANGAATTPQSGCTTTGVTFNAPTAYTDPQFTLAASSTTLIRLVGAASMSDASSSGCQGAIFTIPVNLAAQK